MRACVDAATTLLDRVRSLPSLGRARRRQPHRAQVPLRRPPRTLAQGLLQRLRQAPAQERRLHDLLLGKLLCCSDVR